MSAVLGFAGAALLFILRLAGILLAVVLALALVLLLIPFCADVSWAEGVLVVKAGACGLTLPVLRLPKPQPQPPAPPKGPLGRLRARLRAARAAKKQRRAAQKAAARAAKKAAPKPRRTGSEKAKLTLHIVVVILQGAGRLIRAVFGALRFTHIRILLPVRGKDPADTGKKYGQANAALYGTLGFLDRFIYLDFEQLSIQPDFTPPGGDAPAAQPQVSFCLRARLLFVAVAAVRVLYEFYRQKVLDVFL